MSGGAVPATTATGGARPATDQQENYASTAGYHAQGLDPSL
jgi:hypothetical protein